MSNEINRKPITDNNGNVIGWIRTSDETQNSLTLLFGDEE